MGLAAGRLNRRVTVRRKTLVPDGLGGRTTEWNSVVTLWAEVANQSGREAVLAGTLTGVSTFRVTIRWRGDITVADQLRLEDGRDLNIRSAEDPDGRRDALVIFADTAAVED